MKTFRKNQKVAHLEYGVGTVKKLRNNGIEGYIDFSGVGYRMRADDPRILDSVNKYTPKPDAIKILNEIHKLQIAYQKRVQMINEKSEISDVMLAHRSSLNESIQNLENILQGVGNEL